MNPKVDTYLENVSQWQMELTLLREIILECILTEEFKWKNPCYTYNKKNILIIGGFKDNCVISFLKGALLSDPEKILFKPGENSQSARVVRFTDGYQITQKKDLLKAYISEAIEIEKAGLKVEFKKDEKLELPAELQQKLKELPNFKTAFEALTPGRQRGYVLHFSGAKQSKTVVARIQKYIPLILKGKGINDCTCGLSKRMPSCDGSHKNITAK